MNKKLVSNQEKFVQLKYAVQNGKTLSLEQIVEQMSISLELAKELDENIKKQNTNEVVENCGGIKPKILPEKDKNIVYVEPKEYFPKEILDKIDSQVNSVCFDDKEIDKAIDESWKKHQNHSFLQKAKAVVIGHAIGDALGVPVEFCKRSELDKNPVVNMRGFGSYPVPAGAWSDDTSMSLCALATMTGDKLDFNAVMLNFVRWYYRDDFTPTGLCFDVGNTCSIAIENWLMKKLDYTKCGPKDEYSNGNGSLMRIHPFVLFVDRLDTDIDTKVKLVEMASAITHAHKRSKIACGIYAFVLWELFKKPSKDSVLIGLEKARAYYWSRKDCAEEFDKHYSRLFNKVILRNCTRDDIKSSGYVADTLEAAIWCLLNTKGYRDCVLTAVNLGDDADTVGAIAGGLAGAMYGYDRIPKEWKQQLLRKDYILQLCKDAFDKE